MPDFWFLPLKGPSGCKLDRETDRDGKKILRQAHYLIHRKAKTICASTRENRWIHTLVHCRCLSFLCLWGVIYTTDILSSDHWPDRYVFLHKWCMNTWTHTHTRFWQVNLAEEEWRGGNVGRNKLITAWWREITSENEGNGWKKCSSWRINTQNHNLHPKRSHFINVWVWVFIFIPLFTGCVCVGNANNLK